MRFIRALAVLPVLLCACGGGGGGGGGDPAERQAGQTLLEDCGLAALIRYLDALGVTVDIVDPNGTSVPAITVTNVNQTAGSITWSVSLTGDPAPEAFGIIQFQNPQSQPAEPPFDITHLMPGDLSTLDQDLALLPDGWSISVTVNSPLDPNLTSRFVYTFTSSAVSGVTGTGNVQSAPCGTLFNFAGAALADLVGAFPSIDVTTSYGDGTTSLAGTTSFDGTDVADVGGKVNGGSFTYHYDVDLGAGTVTPK